MYECISSVELQECLQALENRNLRNPIPQVPLALIAEIIEKQVWLCYTHHSCTRYHLNRIRYLLDGLHRVGQTHHGDGGVGNDVQDIFHVPQ